MNMTFEVQLPRIVTTKALKVVRKEVGQDARMSFEA